MPEISTREARRLAIISQGLHTTKPFGAGRQAVQRCIEQLGYVQIDTISVINRSHHHTFWTRVPSYSEKHLDALQKEGRILEYWSHAAAYLPMQDYRFCLPYMHAVASGQKHWRRPDKKAMQAMLDRVRLDGPLKSSDLEHPKTCGSWRRLISVGRLFTGRAGVMRLGSCWLLNWRNKSGRGLRSGMPREAWVRGINNSAAMRRHPSFPDQVRDRL